MKKSVLGKILLALVMVALVCSLAACGGNKKPSGGSDNTTTSETTALKVPSVGVTGGTVSWGTVKGAGTYEYVITDADGKEVKRDTTKGRSVTIEEGQSVVVRAIPSDEKLYTASEFSEKVSYQSNIQTQIISLVKGIQGITDTISEVGADDKLSADLSVGGYIKSPSKNTNNSINLSAQANASKSDPEFMISFKLNEKDYVSLGYKDAKLYVREPINKVNTNEETANAFVVDVTALEPSVKSLMIPVMNALAAAKIDFSKITSAVSAFLNGFQMDLSTLIDMPPKEGDKVTLGIKIALLSTGVTMLQTMKIKDETIPAMVDKYIGYANQALQAIGLNKISFNGTELNWATIKKYVTEANDAVNNEITDATKGLTKQEEIDAATAKVKQSLLKIVASYDNKVINNISLVADLGVLRIPNLDHEAGLEIKLPTFAKNGNDVSINTNGFTAQDIVIDLNAGLEQKGLDATVQGVVRLSDGLANKTNKWATVTVTGNNEYKATGYIDATGAYVDFSGVYTLLGVTGQPAVFQQKFTEDGKEINLIDKLNAKVAESVASNAANADGDRSWDSYEFNLQEIISGVSGASDVVDYICGYVYNNFIYRIDDTVSQKEAAGQADVITWLFNYKLGDTNSSAKDYALFYKDANTFTALLDNIKACHEQGKTALEAATNAEGKTAGVQLIKEGDNNDILDYLSYFVKIPTITADNNVDFENLESPNNTTALVAWLNWIFPTTNEYRQLVDQILGIGLQQIIQDGVYFEAIGGTGLAGSIKVASDNTSDAKVYSTIGAGIDIKSGAATVANIATDDNTVSFNQKNEGTGKYYIQEAAKAMLDALKTYQKVAD